MVAAQKRVLTDKGLDALKRAPAGTRYVIWDAQQPHLGVRVTDKAAKSFIVVKRRPGASHPDTVVLGRYPVLTLKDARAKVPEVLGLLADGKTPAQAEAEAAAEVAAQEATRRANTVAKAIDHFIRDQEARSLRSWSGVEAVLRRDFLGQVPTRRKEPPAGAGRAGARWTTTWADGPLAIWRDQPVVEIRRSDVVARLDQIKIRGGKYAARHALAAIRQFFNWCAEGGRFGIEASPCSTVRDKTIGIVGRDLKRKRVLDDSELRSVWLAAAAQGYPFGPVVQLLMLTGQRLNDIASAQRHEIAPKAAILTVPPERYKTGTAHEVPLTRDALDILDKIPTFGARNYMFTTTDGARPISGFSKMKERLDASIAAQRKADELPPMAPWILHDLRRTVRTRLISDLSIDSFIAERIIGHALPGLHGVYDQGSHRAQKRDGLERWAARLMEIVGREPPTITDLAHERAQRRARGKRAAA